MIRTGATLEEVTNKAIKDVVDAINATVTGISGRLPAMQTCVSLVGETLGFRFAISVIDNINGPIAAADITAGTYDLIRIRDGVETVIVNDGAFSKAAGLVYVDINFNTDDTWNENDAYMLIPNMDQQAVIDAVTYYLQIAPWSGMVIDLENISSEIATIEGKLDNATYGLAALNADLDTIIALLGSPVGASISVDIADIEAKLDARLDATISSRSSHTPANVRQSVCLTGDPGNSIGKALYEIYVNRLTALRAGYLDEINAGALAQGAGSVANNAELDSLVRAIADIARAGGTGDLADILAQTEERVAGRTQVLVEAVTSAANAGNVVLTTVTTQPCLIDTVIIHAVTAQTADLTSCAVYAGASEVLTLIDAGNATQAALDAIDKQVSETDLGIRLAAGKTITMTLVGSGATAVNLIVTIVYKAEVSGGYLN